MGIHETMTLEPPTTNQTERPALLIVDDEAGPRESLRIVFKDRYDCAIATCGREGVEYARTHRVDAAILDIKMPDLSGVEVLKQLKEIDPNIECVMLTGYETVETARAAVRYGASDYLNKPFDVFFVRDLMERCMARRQRKLAMEVSLRTLERMNEDLSQGLAESHRAVAANVLSAGVVHEINNPLTIVAAYAQLLSRDLTALQAGDQNASQQIQQRLANIQREIERCKIITKRFLDFTRASRQEPEVVEVARVLEDAAALIKAHPASKCATIMVEVNDPTLKVKVHPAELLQVLINLGTNGLQAMHGDGTLRFAALPAQTVPTESVVRSRTFDPRCRMVQIAISDTGSGISPENLKRIFEPYFTTKDEGSGLGLAIVGKLVDHYGGLVNIDSVEGLGTTFSVYLPLSA
jgi:two-component system, sensor histidine kinase and response regulator